MWVPLVKTIRFITQPFTLTLILFLIQLSIFIYTSTRPYRISPPGYTYNAIGQNFYYPSMIRQSKDGAWGIMDTHTTKHNTIVYAQLFFVVLGKIAAVFSLDPITMYQLARISGGLAVFAATYLFIITILPKAVASLAVFLALGMQTGPLLTSLGKPILEWAPSFDYQEMVTRHFGLPHHRWGEALGLLFLVLFYKTSEKFSVIKAIALFLVAIAATTTLPPYIFTVAVTVLPVWFLWNIFHKRLKTSLPAFAASGIGILLSALCIKHEFAKDLPWSVGLSAEKSWWDNVKLVTQYVSSILPYVPWIFLAFVLLTLLWKHWHEDRRRIILTLFAWVIGPFVYMWIAKEPWFPVANFRLTDGYVYVPAGILSALGIDTFLRLLKNTVAQNIIRSAIALILVLVSTFLTVVYTKQIFAGQENFWSNIYPSKTTWQAVLALDTLNIPKGSGVLVAEYFGEILPAYANIRVYIGGTHGFPEWPQWQANVRTFFAGDMTDEAALGFLKENDLTYIFYGPDEQSFNRTGTLYPNVLTAMYLTPTVTVYKVQ